MRINEILIENEINEIRIPFTNIGKKLNSFEHEGIKVIYSSEVTPSDIIERIVKNGINLLTGITIPNKFIYAKNNNRDLTLKSGQKYFVNFILNSSVENISITVDYDSKNKTMTVKGVMPDGGKFIHMGKYKKYKLDHMEVNDSQWMVVEQKEKISILISVE